MRGTNGDAKGLRSALAVALVARSDPAGVEERGGGVHVHVAVHVKVHVNEDEDVVVDFDGDGNVDLVVPHLRCAPGLPCAPALTVS